MNTKNTTTLFDLNQTAAVAAVTALGKDALSVESIKLEAFTAAGHDRVDFSQWESYYANHVRNYTALKATPSPAAKQALAAPNAPVDTANKTQASATATVAQP
ncbi:MAG: hypothetical protein ABSE48_02695 [Verrucomicrobiota bacterium]|jgi:hypothetical protein